jgi:hypothetical protein
MTGRRAKRFLATWTPLYPAAVVCVQDNLDALGAHLLFPAEDRKRIRHSNLIERTFGQSRRRVKVIGRLPGEQSCLSLVWAVLDRAAKGWRGLAMTPRRCASSKTCGANVRPAMTISTRGGDRPDCHRRRVPPSHRSLRPEPFTPLLRGCASRRVRVAGIALPAAGDTRERLTHRGIPRASIRSWRTSTQSMGCSASQGD